MEDAGDGFPGGQVVHKVSINIVSQCNHLAEWGRDILRDKFVDIAIH